MNAEMAGLIYTWALYGPGPVSDWGVVSKKGQSVAVWDTPNLARVIGQIIKGVSGHSPQLLQRPVSTQCVYSNACAKCSQLSTAADAK